MEDQITPLQTIIGLCLIGGFLVLVLWALIYNLRYKEKNVATILARSGWKHELVRKGTVERRFSSVTDGIHWTMEFKVPESKSDSAQLELPTILEWRTSDARLASGMVVITTIPGGDREGMNISYQIMLGELDIWLSSDLSPHQIGSIEFQGRYTVMADSEERAWQVVKAAEKPLLQWPEWEVSRLVPVPTPVLMADRNGITIRIALDRLGVPSNRQKLKNPYVDRVFAVVRLGVDIAAGLRDT
jgi:hypothetical protein